MLNVTLRFVTLRFVTQVLQDPPLSSSTGLNVCVLGEQAGQQR